MSEHRQTDSHLHLWDRAGGGYGWLEGAPRALRRDATWAEAAPQLNGLGIERVILVQADDTAEDTAFLQRAAARIEAAGRAGESTVAVADVVAWLPLTDPADLARILEDPARLRHVVGVRQLIHDDPDPDLLDRAEVQGGLELLAARGLPLDVPDAFPRHLEQAARVAGAHPSLTLVLDHLGKPPLGDEQAMLTWQRQLRRLAAHPRTVAKVSGLATSGRGYRAADHLRRALDLAFEVFGPHRLMFGSDWPIAPVPFDLAEGTAPLLELLGQLPDADRAEVMAGTAGRVYRRLAS